MAPPPEPGAQAPAEPAPAEAEEPPPPPPVWSPRALWDPAGDAGPCRDAAAAWRRQAGVLSGMASTLKEAGSPLPDYWKGQAGTGHQQTEVDLLAEIQQAADDCNEVATTLDKIAGDIDEFNDSIHELWIAVGSIAAVSIVGAFFTFGASAAAGAAATAGYVARATSLVRALRATLALAKPILSLRAANFAGLGAKWAKVIQGISLTPRLVAPGARLTQFGKFYKGMGTVFAGGLPFTFANKALSGNNPFDLGNWRVEDLTASLYGAALFGGVGNKLTPFRGPLKGPVSKRQHQASLAALGDLHARGLLSTEAFKGLTTLVTVRAMSHPTRWGFVAGSVPAGLRRGLVFGTMAEPVGRYVIYDSDPKPQDVQQAGLNISATGAGFGLQALWQAGKGPPSALGGIARGGVIFIPATLISLVGTATQGTKIVPQQGTPLFPWLAKAQDAPSGVTLQPPASGAEIKPPPLRELKPGEVFDQPTREPLRVTVRPGESLWEFSERVYGDGNEYPRIARANNFELPEKGNPDLIHPGQELLIPPLPNR